MAAWRFSVRADGDLMSIAFYTTREWGEEQALRYLDDLEACCQQLADHPAGPRVRRDPPGSTTDGAWTARGVLSPAESGHPDCPGPASANAAWKTVGG